MQIVPKETPMQHIAKKNLNVGKAIREIRTARSLSQAELARRAKLSAMSISQIETERRGISPRTRERIAKALNVPESFLYVLADEHPSDIVATFQKMVRKSLSIGQERSRSEQAAASEDVTEAAAESWEMTEGECADFA